MEIDIEKLIESFKASNQSLRKRAIGIGVLMILTIALTYSENVRYDHISDLLDYQYKLEEISELPDSAFQTVINGDDNEKYFDSWSLNSEELAHTRLFQKIKMDGYQRTLIQQEIDNLDQKMEETNKNESIGIVGLNVPIEPITYVSLILVLILFHDFAQIIIYRNQIHRKIRKYNIPYWKLGFEFFGFYNDTKNPSVKFLRLTSSMIVTALVLSPLATSFLMTNFNHTNSSFLSILNVICFTLIIIDTIIILHIENILNFRFFSNRYLGKHNFSKGKMQIIWIAPMLFILMVNIMISTSIMSVTSLICGLFFLFNLIPMILLYIFLNITFDRPNNINRSIRSGLLVLNVFWIYVLVNTAVHVEEWRWHSIENIQNVLIVGLITCSVYSWIYFKYFIKR